MKTIPELEQLLLQVAPALDRHFNPEIDKTGRTIGFLICAFDFGEKGALAYLSNANKQHLEAALEELIRSSSTRASSTPSRMVRSDDVTGSILEQRAQGELGEERDALWSRLVEARDRLALATARAQLHGTAHKPQCPYVLPDDDPDDPGELCCKHEIDHENEGWPHESEFGRGIGDPRWRKAVT